MTAHHHGGISVATPIGTLRISPGDREKPAGVYRSRPASPSWDFLGMMPPPRSLTFR
jgi:hypothetical protein